MPECHSGGDCPDTYKCSWYPDKSECHHRREYLVKTNHKRHIDWLLADFDAFCSNEDTLLRADQRKDAHEFIKTIGAISQRADDTSMLEIIIRWAMQREHFEPMQVECPRCGKTDTFPKNTGVEFLCSECGEWLNKPGCVVIPEEDGA